MTWIPVTETTTTAPNGKYLVDTTLGEFSIVLPEFPNVGTSVILADIADVSVNKIAVLTQTEFPFEGGGAFFLMDIPKSQFEFIFNGFNWIVYNLSRRGIKVSNLPVQPISQISNDDLVPFVNKSGNSFESTAIPFINLKQKITEGVFTSAEDIINAINDTTGSATLNIKTLDGKSSDYYLDYNNLMNTPPRLTLVSQLNNDRGYVTNLNSFTTDNLAEGQTNKYLSDLNFKALFDPSFAESYRLFSGDFPEQSIRDSAESIQATPLTINNSTNFINISNPNDLGLFFPGKKIKIYGASVVPIVDILTPAMGAATKRGFDGVIGGNSVRYKVMQFNFLSGEFSPTSNESNQIQNVDFELFNDINNISISFSRTSTDYGVLIYRAVGSASFILIDVLGPRQLGSTIQNVEYVDYGKFNFVTWSRKNVSAGNVYDANTGLVHFPPFLTSINRSSRGWADSTVVSVDVAARRIRIEDTLYLNPNITISEDDTEQVQNAINQRRNLGVNSLTLNDRRYIVSRLDIPSNFSLFGRGQATIIRKISWDFNQNNKIISPIGALSRNIVLSNFTIDGNMQNQWLKSESGDPYTNYAIDLKEESVGNIIDRIRMTNLVGGGIASSRANKLLIDKSRIEDSGMADFFEYSPLIADDGLEIVITNNIFQNFTAAIDISLCDNGVFTSNIVQNVGSGVIVYGSKFLISAPNIIRGPAGEFIPGPDVINSVYDSVNIKLNPGTDFTSDSHRYQVNGISFDITANRAALNFRMDKLRLVSNVEELYGEVLMTDVVGQTWDLALIAEALVANTASTTSLFVTQLLVGTNPLGDINQDGLVDAADRLALLAYVNGTQTNPLIVSYIENNFIPFLNLNIIAYADYRADVLQFRKPIQRVFDVGLDATQGVFKWGISLADVNTITNDFSVSKIRLTEPNHIGLVYSAELTEYVPSGRIIDADTSLTSTFPISPNEYKVTVTNFENLKVGAKIRMLNHGGTPNLNTLVGTITEITIPAAGQVPEANLTISYDEPITVAGGINGTASQNQITIENTFILVKGRVI